MRAHHNHPGGLHKKDPREWIMTHSDKIRVCSTLHHFETNGCGRPPLRPLRTSHPAAWNIIPSSIETCSLRLRTAAKIRRLCRARSFSWVSPTSREPVSVDYNGCRLLRAIRESAEVAELADALDSNSSEAHTSCGFDPRLRHLSAPLRSGLPASRPEGPCRNIRRPHESIGPSGKNDAPLHKML